VTGTNSAGEGSETGASGPGLVIEPADEGRRPAPDARKPSRSLLVGAARGTAESAAAAASASGRATRRAFSSGPRAPEPIPRLAGRERGRTTWGAYVRR